MPAAKATKGGANTAHSGPRFRKSGDPGQRSHFLLADAGFRGRLLQRQRRPTPDGEHTGQGGKGVPEGDQVLRAAPSPTTYCSNSSRASACWSLGS